MYQAQRPPNNYNNNNNGNGFLPNINNGGNGNPPNNNFGNNGGGGGYNSNNNTMNNYNNSRGGGGGSFSSGGGYGGGGGGGGGGYHNSNNSNGNGYNNQGMGMAGNSTGGYNNSNNFNNTNYAPNNQQQQHMPNMNNNNNMNNMNQQQSFNNQQNNQQQQQQQFNNNNPNNNNNMNINNTFGNNTNGNQHHQQQNNHNFGGGGANGGGNGTHQNPNLGGGDTKDQIAAVVNAVEERQDRLRRASLDTDAALMELFGGGGGGGSGGSDSSGSERSSAGTGGGGGGVGGLGGTIGSGSGSSDMFNFTFGNSALADLIQTRSPARKSSTLSSASAGSTGSGEYDDGLRSGMNSKHVSPTNRAEGKGAGGGSGGNGEGLESINPWGEGLNSTLNFAAAGHLVDDFGLTAGTEQKFKEQLQEAIRYSKEQDQKEDTPTDKEGGQQQQQQQQPEKNNAEENANQQNSPSTIAVPKPPSAALSSSTAPSPARRSSLGQEYVPKTDDERQFMARIRRFYAHYCPDMAKGTLLNQLIYRVYTSDKEKQDQFVERLVQKHGPEPTEVGQENSGSFAAQAARRQSAVGQTDTHGVKYKGIVFKKSSAGVWKERYLVLTRDKITISLVNAPEGDKFLTMSLTHIQDVRHIHADDGDDIGAQAEDRQNVFLVVITLPNRPGVEILFDAPNEMQRMMWTSRLTQAVKEARERQEEQKRKAAEEEEEEEDK